MNPELKKYVDEARFVGKSDVQISQDLRGAGWSEAEISSGITGVPSPEGAGSSAGSKTLTTILVIMAVIFLPTLIMQGIYRASSGNNYNDESTPIVLPPLPLEEKYVETIKYNIFNVRANAESYYDSNKNSYKDMCNTTKDPLAKVYSDLRAIPDVVITCDSTQYEYAISVMAESGRYWCADSSGFAGETYATHKGTVCR